MGTYHDDQLLAREEEAHRHDVEHAGGRPNFLVVAEGTSVDIGLSRVGGYRVRERVRLPGGPGSEQLVRRISGFAIHEGLGIVAIFREGGSLSIERLTPVD